jgi:long-subunit acyl-CoA synthetase (AMP-forming)
MEVTIADDREILPRVHGGSLAELAAGAPVLAEAASGVADDDERLARVQQVEYWYLLPMGWTAETDELATTLKLERRVVHASWAVVTDSLYGCE